MAELKTKKTKASVAGYLKTIDKDRQEDCRTICKMMEEISGEKPKMWGASMVGFGQYHYKYASGREGNWFVTGFASRKNALTLYIMAGFSKHDALLEKLGKYKTGKACLYVKKLEDINLKVLKKLITLSVDYMKKKYPDD